MLLHVQVGGDLVNDFAWRMWLRRDEAVDLRLVNTILVCCERNCCRNRGSLVEYAFGKKCQLFFAVCVAGDFNRKLFERWYTVVFVFKVEFNPPA
jgi:hypothetical protein